MFYLHLQRIINLLCAIVESFVIASPSSWAIVHQPVASRRIACLPVRSPRRSCRHRTAVVELFENENSYFHVQLFRSTAVAAAAAATASVPAVAAVTATVAVGTAPRPDKRPGNSYLLNESTESFTPLRTCFLFYRAEARSEKSFSCRRRIVSINYRR